MGLACVPEHSNSIFPVLESADAADSPVANLNAITNRKSPRHLSRVNFFSQSIASEATIELVDCPGGWEQAEKKEASKS